MCSHISPNENGNGLPLPQMGRVRALAPGRPASGGESCWLAFNMVGSLGPKPSRRKRILRSAGILAGFAALNTLSRSQTGAPAGICACRRAGFPAGRFTGLSGPVFVRGAGKPPEPADRKAGPARLGRCRPALDLGPRPVWPGRRRWVWATPPRSAPRVGPPGLTGRFSPLRYR